MPVSRFVGVAAATTFVIAVVLAAAGSVLGSRYLAYPWNLVAPLLLATGAGLVGAGATWLLDVLRRRRRRRGSAAAAPVDPVERTLFEVAAS